jgi:hypothetical protein
MGPGVFRTVTNRWERFWFEDVPSEAVAVVRLAIGTAGLISLVGFIPVETFWSPDGIAPVPEPGGLRSYLLESGFSAWGAWLIFGVLAVSFTCMILGLFTSVAVASCFLGSVFQTHWNPLPLTSGHTVLVAVLFCLIWSDCGARLSLDGWRRQQRSVRDRARQPIWPLRLIQIQVAIVYLTSGLFKLLAPAWRSGAAVHYATGHNVYGRVFHVYAWPPSLDWTLTLLTYATLLWELSFPLLLVHRTTRGAALAAGVAIHGGIWATMEIGPFSWMMIATYSAFLDPHALASVRRYPKIRNERAVSRAVSA